MIGYVKTNLIMKDFTFLNFTKDRAQLLNLDDLFETKKWDLNKSKDINICVNVESCWMNFDLFDMTRLMRVKSY